MIARLLNYFKRPTYTYGFIYRPSDGHMVRKVRKNNKTGDMEFVLWEAGEQGHEVDYWHPMCKSWEQFFVKQEHLN